MPQTRAFRRIPPFMSHATISKSILRLFSSFSIRAHPQKWFPTSFRELSTSSMTTCSSKPPPVQPPLYTQHGTFTHGGNYWRDNYLLERWRNCQQPVVYLGDVYNNYELRLRLGDWCWLTKDPTSAFPGAFAAGSYTRVSVCISHCFGMTCLSLSLSLSPFRLS